MDKYKDIELGKVIKRLRKNKFLSQKELADRCERDLKNISNLERGISLPNLSTFINIALALEMLPSELMKELEKGVELKKLREELHKNNKI